jgi:hypothetical protein
MQLANRPFLDEKEGGESRAVPKFEIHNKCPKEEYVFSQILIQLPLIVIIHK